MKAKRFLASFLALCMLVTVCSTTLATTAFATVTDKTGAEIVVSNDTTTTGLNLSGKVFNAYEVFRAEITSAGTSGQDGIQYTVNDDFVEFFKSKLTGYASFDYAAATAAEKTTFNDAATKYVQDNKTDATNTMAELVKQLRTYVLTTGNNVPSVASTGAVTTADGIQTVSTSTNKGLLGYYLVLDSTDSLTPRTDTSSVIPAGALVTVPTHDTSGTLTQNATIIVKGSQPKITKEIWHNDKANTGVPSPDSGTKGEWDKVGDYEIGDTVEFRLTVDVPSNLAGYVAVPFPYSGTIQDQIFDYTYIITDTPDDGITIDVSSIELSPKPDFSQPVDNNYHYVTQTPDGGFKITIDMVNLVKTWQELKRFYVHYTATIDETAIVSETPEKNEVTLEYSTNPYDDGTTEVKDKVFLYTFDFDVTKTSGDGVTALPDATFALYYNHYNGKDGATKQIYLKQRLDNKNVPVKIGDYFVYDVTKDEGASDVMPGDGTLPAGTITTKDNAKFTIFGLDDAVPYRLVEINAPNGYNAADPIDFTISAEYAYNPKVDLTPTLTLGSTIGNDLSTTIINTSSALLPTTGGMGTTMFTIGGITMMFGSALIFFIKRRKL